MSRQVIARIAALLYLVNVALGITALLWLQQGRLAAADQVTVAAAVDYAVVVLLLGWLFAPAGRGLSWAVAAIGVVGCALSAVGPLHLATSPVNALAVFGLYCIGLGLLVVRSAMVPRWIGVLLMLGGVSWLTFGIPALSRQLEPWNMAPGAIAELLFTLWLLAFGVRAPAVRATA